MSVGFIAAMALMGAAAQASHTLDITPPRPMPPDIIYCCMESAAIIRIRPDGALLFQDRPVRRADLLPVISREMAAHRCSNHVFIWPDPDVSYARFRDVFDAVTAAGYRQVGLIGGEN